MVLSRKATIGIQIFYTKNRLFFVLGMIFVIANGFLDLVLAYIMQLLIDATGSNYDVTILWKPVYLAVLFIVSYAITLWGFRYFKSKFIKKAVSSYKQELFRKVLYRNENTFSDGAMSEILSYMTNDMIFIEDKYLLGQFQIASISVWLFGSTAFMFWYNWKLALAVVLFSTVSILVSALSGKKMAFLTNAISDSNIIFMGKIKDLLCGFPEIKTFHAEHQVQCIFQNINRSLEENKDSRRLQEGALELFSTLVGYIVQIGIFIVGAYLAIKGEMTAGTVIAFVQLMNYFLKPIQVFPVLLANRKAAVLLFEKAVSKIDVEPEENKKIMKEDLVKIEFRKWGFSYEAGSELFNNIDLTFDEGCSYAIVGMSGKGKSTLLNSIVGSYLDTQKGNIYYNDINLNDISFSYIIDNICLIRQNTFIFNASLLENITMYQNFSSNEIKKAVDIAGLRELISKKGYDYPCGENGCNLSGGEKQRISIARAALKKPGVMLLDEPTSALDTITAKHVMNAILSIENCMKIIVTHKIDKELLSKFDKIVLITDKGIVCDTYESLLKENLYFNTLIQLQ